MSAFAGILKGAMRQGLSDINETNEFYNDLVRTASAHIGNATQAANNAYPEDVKAAEKKYTNYVALVETLGKDKADFIFENTNYLEQDNFMSLSKNVIFKPDFKYYARIEPVETITKNANANINNVKNQICDQVPNFFEFLPSFYLLSQILQLNPILFDSIFNLFKFMILQFRNLLIIY